MTTKLGVRSPGAACTSSAIGGVGMAALAELLLQLGYEISGSDLKSSRTVQRLMSLGRPGPASGRIWRPAPSGADHVVVSAAVPAGQPRGRGGRAPQGAEVLSRAELLGRILDAGRGVAVTGTHGKTTTASMLARALDAAGFEPSFLIGGDLNDVGSGAGLGASDLVVAEADEAFGSFLELRPELALVTNVDLDHLEHYDDQDAIDEAFVRFLDQRREGGTAVLCADDDGVRRIARRVARAGRHVRDRRAPTCSLTPDDAARSRGTGGTSATLRLQVPGRHNLLNAAGALAAALVLGAEPDARARGPALVRAASSGASPLRGEADGVLVVDDYAHNPQKVAATVAAAREAYPDRRIVVALPAAPLFADAASRRAPSARRSTAPTSSS